MKVATTSGMHLLVIVHVICKHKCFIYCYAPLTLALASDSLAPFTAAQHSLLPPQRKLEFGEFRLGSFHERETFAFGSL